MAREPLDVASPEACRGRHHQQGQNGIRQIFRQQSCKWTLNLTGKNAQSKISTQQRWLLWKHKGTEGNVQAYVLSQDSRSPHPSWEQVAGLRGTPAVATKGCYNSRHILGLKSTITYIFVYIRTRFHSLYFTSLISFCLGWNAQHIKNNLHDINGFFGTAFYSSVCYYFSFQKNKIMSLI